MAFSFRKFVKKGFIFFNVLVAIVFLLGFLLPYLNPQKWWLMGFVGLAFPFLLICMILFFVFWLVTKPKIALLPLLCMLVNWKQVNAVFSFSSSANKTNANNLRILTWNVHALHTLNNHNGTDLAGRQKIFDAIIAQKPDVVCLQEFNSFNQHVLVGSSLAMFAKQSGMPYYFFSKDYGNAVDQFYRGSIIFSRYPIVDSARVAFPKNESVVYADIKQGDDTIRVFTTHLQSYKFGKDDYQGINKIKNADEEMMDASKGIIRKLKKAFIIRGEQADIVRKFVDASPYPTLLCGDFNDVPNSYAYWHIKGNMQDAFLAKGVGIGRTFNSLSPTLRIDYLFASDHFAINSFSRIINDQLSDHYALVSDVNLKSKN
jgi:endonuclease/exonuclease/phosphatase family metal-dependent hydrolase